MTIAEVDEQIEWPQPRAALYERPPALAALEEAWREGLLVEHEPAA